MTSIKSYNKIVPELGSKSRFIKSQNPESHNLTLNPSKVIEFPEVSSWPDFPDPLACHAWPFFSILWPLYHTLKYKKIQVIRNFWSKFFTIALIITIVQAKCSMSG